MTVLPPRRRTMTDTERRYMIDAANGLTAQQSASRHGVSVNTVLAMLKRAKFALGAVNITHAAVLAVINGEITGRNLKGTS